MKDKKSIKIPFLIYADVLSLLEKIQTCENNAEKLLPTNVSKHAACGYLIFTHCPFNSRLHDKVLQRYKRACSKTD